MRLAVMICLALVAFAANSILNRAAVDAGLIGSGAFAVIRVASGAAMLTLLVVLQKRNLPLRTPHRWAGAIALSVYMLGFSLAYRSIDAGLGALILFGVVQMSMFLWTSIRGAPPSGKQIAGAAIAFAGLAVVLWPGGSLNIDPIATSLMVAAGIGWGAYTLLGRSESDALAGTAANFLAALGPVAVIGLIPEGIGQIAISGLGLAVLSGAVTSGLGYAIWYAVLPRIDAGLAAVLQSSVPVIALAAGVVLLGEKASLQLAAGAILVLGGIILAIRR